MMNCGSSQSRPCEAGLGILTSWDIFLSLIAQFNLHLSSVWFSISFILHKYVFLMQKTMVSAVCSKASLFSWVTFWNTSYECVNPANCRVLHGC